MADGKLVPSSYLKIVQPAEQGIVKEILVKEGEKVQAGQVLIAHGRRARRRRREGDRTPSYDNKRLALRRIDAQLAGEPLARERRRSGGARRAGAARSTRPTCAPTRMRWRRSARCSTRRATTSRRRRRREAKLEQVLPHYLRAGEGLREAAARTASPAASCTPTSSASGSRRSRTCARRSSPSAATQALIEQSEQKIAQISADYRRQLQTERVEVAAQLERCEPGARQARAPPGPARAARAAGRHRQGSRDAHRRHGGGAGHDPDDARARGRQAARRGLGVQPGRRLRARRDRRRSSSSPRSSSRSTACSTARCCM